MERGNGSLISHGWNLITAISHLRKYLRPYSFCITVLA
jgi:hypothetical protein